MAHYQGYHINDVIWIELPHLSQNNEQNKGVEYVVRSGQTIGMADDGTLILVLYPLESVPSGDNQKKKVDEESLWAGDGNHDGEVPEQLEPTIIYIDQELAFVVLWVSLWDICS